MHSDISDQSNKQLINHRYELHQILFNYFLFHPKLIPVVIQVRRKD